MAFNNARTAGMQEAYRRGTAEDYRGRLTAEAQALGINPDAVAALKAPLLVRGVRRRDQRA